MTQNRYSSPIPASIPDEDNDDRMESCSLGPQNQLGLEQEDQSGLRSDDNTVALDKKGEIKHHEVIAKY